MSKKQKRQKNATKLPRSVKRLFPQVTEVYDSNKIVEVKVGKRDNDSGKRKQSDECAMARAIKREYKADGAIIGMSYSYLIKGNKAIRFKTPDSVSREIVSFDRHHSFEPGEYILTPVSPSNRLGREQHKRSGSHKPTRTIHRTTGIRVLERGSSY